MRLERWCAAATVCLATLGTGPAMALTVTLEECGEGADFIRNAALSRDNGMRAADYLHRLEGDLVAIRSVPPALRWFARDQDDESMLRTAAAAVFAEPLAADDHHRAFLASCHAVVAAIEPPPPVAVR